MVNARKYLSLHLSYCLDEKTVMKKTLLIFIIASILMPFSLFGQGYKDLWKQVEQAAEKDLPKTQISVLNKIVMKAAKEKLYGQLLKAELMKTSRIVEISPDSLEPAIKNLETQALQAEKKDAALAAVYNTILGCIYRNNGRLDDIEKKNVYFQKAISDPKMLAAHKASEYEPLVESGPDSEIFDNDLLSLIGYETENYQALADYYEQVGNRRAALISSLQAIKQKHELRKFKLEGSPYAMALDSLISLYGDLIECGEVAVERYLFMEECSDVLAEEKVNYIDQALAKWGNWKRMNQLRNSRKQLIQPQFAADMESTVVPVLKPITIRIHNVRNIQSIKATVQRVDITGDNDYNLTWYNQDKDKNFEAVKKKIIAGSKKIYTKTYLGKKAYEKSRDTLTIDPLPAGAYLITFRTDNKNIPEGGMLFYVSDLTLLSQSLPDNKLRMAVVNSTTGQPVAGANIKVYLHKRYNQPETIKSLTCDNKGEVIYQFDKSGDYNIRSIYIYTDTDKYCHRSFLPYNNFSFDKNNRKEDHIQLYTDRRIYRPGQTVHVSGIAFNNTNGIETKVIAGRECNLTLRDANYKVVKEEILKTDEFGTFFTDFVLPEGGLSGSFSLRTNWGNGWSAVQVEEYKRPTFEVKFDEVKEKYKNGDTITVTGRAKSYAGVPVQGAKVSYTLSRRKSLWCWWGGASGTEETDAGEAVTNEKGEFTIQMPMVLPSWEDDDNDNEFDEDGYYRMPRFYDFIAKAQVTDQAGESHEGSISIPLGSKPTAFNCNIEKMSERDSLKSFSFTLKNAAGQDIDGTVRYTIDGKNPKLAKANQSIEIHTKNLKSGKHTIEATCGDDHVKTEFVVFTLKDKSPCIETHDWFYQTATTFPCDGKPVTIQVGASDADTHILYNIFSGNKILESGTFDLSNAINTRQFTYKKEYGPGVLLTFAWVKEGNCYTHSTNISAPLPEKKMKMQWTSFRDRLIPGQEEEWTLNILRPDGKAAAAQLMATMYDKSLDQLTNMNWSMNLNLFRGNAHTQWVKLINSFQNQFLSQNISNDKVRHLHFSKFVDDITSFRLGFSMMGSGHRKLMMATRSVVNNKSTDLAVMEEIAQSEPAMAADNSKQDIIVVGYGTAKKKTVTGSAVGAHDVAGNDEEGADAVSTVQEVQLRENLNETALFYPTLLSDENGNVSIHFILPESITTWRFIGLAHDKDMNFGILEGIAVAKKDVMVQPNMPRFVRQGDKAVISTKIFNTAEKNVSGNVTMVLIDPETEHVLLETSKPFSVKQGETGNASFYFEPTVQTPSLLICKIIASGDGFSDGEQHYLPILPNSEMVTVTVPFTQHETGTKAIDLKKLIPESFISDHSIANTPKLTVEYTNNPAWMMVQTLPYVGNINEKNAISLAAAYYANSIGNHLIKQSPKVKSVFQQWQQEKNNETSLMSSLQKNQELKTLLLEETPWVMNAEQESDQKIALANFFDENTMQNRLNTAIEHLQNLQNPDGSFSWWKGMNGSPAMTAEVMEFLTRLNMLTGEDDNTVQLLNKANQFLSQIVIKEVAEMKRLEKEKKPVYINGYHALQWIYLNAISGRQLNTKEKDATTYLMKYLEKQITSQSLYAKALMAVVLSKQQNKAKALEYVKSLKEYTVYKEEMGRYYDSPRASYSWYDYRIPTQTAVIEALKIVTPNDLQTIEEMKRWLLQEKRTQCWDTPINSVNAVYAFLDGNTQILENKEMTKFAIDGEVIELPKVTAGLGYVKTTFLAGNAKQLTAEKSSEGTSWGAVYAQFMQHTKDIASSSSGIIVTREILSAKDGKTNNGTYHVGDKVKVRITIVADRDYDFVQLIDKRAACMEPVNQLSGYHWGYYCSPKDCTTNYYFDLLSKGRHVIETEYFIDRSGIYETGTATVQCAYAPEFTGQDKSQTIHVE